MTTVRDLYNALFAFAPASMKYDWDNVGLLCGHFDAPVDTVLVALDPNSLAHTCLLSTRMCRLVYSTTL